jgi:hypothetical protein
LLSVLATHVCCAPLRATRHPIYYAGELGWVASVAAHRGKGLGNLVTHGVLKRLHALGRGAAAAQQLTAGFRRVWRTDACFWQGSRECG